MEQCVAAAVSCSPTNHALLTSDALQFSHLTQPVHLSPSLGQDELASISFINPSHDSFATAAQFVFPNDELDAFQKKLKQTHQQVHAVPSQGASILTEAMMKSKPTIVQPHDSGKGGVDTRLTFLDPFASATSQAGLLSTSDLKTAATAYSTLQRKAHVQRRSASPTSMVTGDDPTGDDPTGVPANVSITSSPPEKKVKTDSSTAAVSENADAKESNVVVPLSSRKRPSRPRSSRAASSNRSAASRAKAAQKDKGQGSSKADSVVTQTTEADGKNAKEPVNVTASLEGAQATVEHLMNHQTWLSMSPTPLPGIDPLTKGNAATNEVFNANSQRQMEVQDLEQILRQDMALKMQHASTSWSNAMQSSSSLSAPLDASSIAVAEAIAASASDASAWLVPSGWSEGNDSLHDPLSMRTVPSFSGFPQAPVPNSLLLTSSALPIASKVGFPAEGENYKISSMSSHPIRNTDPSLFMGSTDHDRHGLGMAFTNVPQGIFIPENASKGLMGVNAEPPISFAQASSFPASKYPTSFVLAQESQSEQLGWYVVEGQGPNVAESRHLFHPAAEFSVRPLLTGVVAQLHNDWLDQHSQGHAPQNPFSGTNKSLSVKTQNNVATYFPQVEATLESRHVRQLWQELERRRVLQLQDPTLIAQFHRQAREELRKEAEARVKSSGVPPTTLGWTTYEPSRQEVDFRAQVNWNRCRSAAAYTVGLLRQAEYCMAQGALGFEPLNGSRIPTDGKKIAQQHVRPSRKGEVNAQQAVAHNVTASDFAAMSAGQGLHSNLKVSQHPAADEKGRVTVNLGECFDGTLQDLSKGKASEKMGSFENGLITPRTTPHDEASIQNES